VLAGLRQSAQELENRLGAIIAVRPRGHPDRGGVIPEPRRWVGIIFRKLDCYGHIHHLADARIAIGGSVKLGQIARDRRIRIEQALVRQHGRDQADEGLGHRHGQVRNVRLQGPEIPLIDHHAPMQHQDAVGAIDVDGLAPGQFLAIHGGEGDAVQIVAQRLWQFRRGAAAAPDGAGRDQLPLMAERPSIVREAPTRPVLQPHRPVRRRRKTLHQLASLRVALGGARRGGHVVALITADRLYR